MANYYKILEPGDGVPPGVFSTGDVDAAEAENLWNDLNEITLVLWALIGATGINAEDSAIEIYPSRGRSREVNVKVALESCMRTLAKADPGWMPVVPRALRDGEGDGLE